MSSIDRALMRAFERRETANDHRRSSDTPSVDAPLVESQAARPVDGVGVSTRELYIHAFHPPRSRVTVVDENGTNAHPVGAEGEAAREVPHARLIRIDAPAASTAHPTVGGEQERVLAKTEVPPSFDDDVWMVSNAEVVGWQLSDSSPTGVSELHAADEREMTPDAERWAESGDDSAADELDGKLEEAEEEFKPAWEVDWFTLPELLHRAIDTLGDQLQSAIHQVLQDCTATRSLVTIRSVQRGEGRTTVAIMLALAAAKTGCRVLLVDGDLSRPTLANDLGIAVPTAWTQQHATSHDLAECCVHSVRDGFTVMALPEHAADVSANVGEQLVTALDELVQHFDIVICDLGPQTRTNFREHLTDVACHVLVRHAARTSDEDFEQFMRDELERSGDSVRVIDNFATLPEVA